VPASSGASAGSSATTPRAVARLMGKRCREDMSGQDKMVIESEGILRRFYGVATRDFSGEKSLN
jgi:hypothetical protein